MIYRVLAVNILSFLFANHAFTQSIGKFDIVSHQIPQGWVKETGRDFICYTISNNETGGYARILLYKSLPGTGNVEPDFDTEWKELVQANYSPGDFTNRNVSNYKEGWVSKIGVAPFRYKNQKQVVILNTLVKNKIKMSNVFITNTEAYETDYENFGSSLNFDNPAIQEKPGIPAGNQTKVPVGETIKPSEDRVSGPGNFDARLIGKWNRSGAIHTHYADASSWGTAGYTTCRYEFKPGGTYEYTERSFRMTYPFILIVKENGNFSVSNNLLTIVPEKSVMESYTKKNNVDELGTLAKSENRTPETTTYTFTFHFFSGIQEWNLVLQAQSPTKRDGNFSSNNTFPNAWYFDQKYTGNDLTSPKGN